MLPFGIILLMALLTISILNFKIEFQVKYRFPMNGRNIHFLNSGEKKLKEKGLLDEVYQLLEKLDFNTTLKQNKDILSYHQFTLAEKVPIEGINPELEAFNRDNKIGLKVQRNEQIDVRSDLLFAEIGYRKDFMDFFIYVLKNSGNANFNRVRNELQSDLFSHYFPVTIPLCLVGYSA